MLNSGFHFRKPVVQDSGQFGVGIGFQVLSNRIGSAGFESFPKRFGIVRFVELMGDEFEGGIVSGTGFGGEAKNLVVFGDVFRRDNLAKSNPIDATADSVAD